MNKPIKNLDDLVRLIPKQSYSVTGKPMEPINIIFIAPLSRLKKVLEDHGWFEAVRLSFKTLAKAIYTSTLNRRYNNGPISPSYIRRRHFFIGFERPTGSDTFRRRHHMRVWKTRYSLHGSPVWVGTISYDRTVGVDGSGVIPTHHIAPTLLWDEKFLAQSLGVKHPKFVKVAEPIHGQLNNGDGYTYDGRALVLDFSRLG